MSCNTKDMLYLINVSRVAQLHCCSVTVVDLVPAYRMKLDDFKSASCSFLIALSICDHSSDELIFQSGLILTIYQPVRHAKIRALLLSVSKLNELVDL